jgi:hypothetical protein
MMQLSTRFPSGLPPGYLAWFVQHALEGFALGCTPSMRIWALPPLYKANVRWRLEPDHGSGREEFALPPDVYRRGWGDCDDLIIWSLAERWQPYSLAELPTLIAAGRVPRCTTEWEGGAMHVALRLPDGTIEDPSKKLGM